MQTSLWLLLSAIGLGVVDRYLIGDTTLAPGIAPVGLGLTLIVLLNITAGALSLVLLRKSDYRSLVLLIPAALAAIGMTWRASPWLFGLDLAVIAMCTNLALARAQNGKPILSSLLNSVSEIFNRHPIIGAFELIIDDIRWRDLMSDKTRLAIKASMRGMVIALPLVLIFGTLFCAADAAFAKQLGYILKIDAWATIKSAWFIFVFSVLAASIMRTMSSNQSRLNMTFSESLQNGGEVRKGNLGLTETATILGALNVLFGAFVGIQVKYLFGGNHLVQITEGLTYAEYARHGFFELCVVSVLVIPLLLLLDYLCKREGKTSEIAFRSLAGMMLVLLSVIIVSAVQRMSMYSQTYGYSELRLYTTGFMYWLTSVCLIFGITVLRNHRERFMPLTFVSGLVSIAVLHLYNPDAEIMRVNIAINSKMTIDRDYALKLSEDSIPILVDDIGKLNYEDRKQIAATLLARKTGALKTDWRSFNWSRMCAYQAVERNIVKLQELAAAP